MFYTGLRLWGLDLLCFTYEGLRLREAHFYVFYEVLRVWEVHLYMFYESLRLCGGSGSNEAKRS